MRIVEIVPVTKTKYRVVTDEQLAFMLYKGELSRYRLKENGELSAEIFQEIFREILVKRAKLRAMHLLTRMDYTEAELEKKLMKGEYTPQAVKIAMDYVRSYHYLDDERYVARYLSAYQGRKSRRQMQFELERKGIPREMIQRRQEAMDDEEGCVDETNMIRQLLEKYSLVPKRGISLAAATVRGLILTVSHKEQIGELYPQVLETLVYGACRELFE
jgi:regulatory protein